MSAPLHLDESSTRRQKVDSGLTGAGLIGLGFATLIWQMQLHNPDLLISLMAYKGISTGWLSLWLLINS